MTKIKYIFHCQTCNFDWNSYNMLLQCPRCKKSFNHMRAKVIEESDAKTIEKDSK